MRAWGCEWMPLLPEIKGWTETPEGSSANQPRPTGRPFPAVIKPGGLEEYVDMHYLPVSD